MTHHAKRRVSTYWRKDPVRTRWSSNYPWRRPSTMYILWICIQKEYRHISSRFVGLLFSICSSFFTCRMLIKRAQGRKKILKVKNFKRRHFCLTNQKLSYSKMKGDNPIYEIPIGEILAVETLQEQSFKMKYVGFSVWSHINII